MKYQYPTPQEVGIVMPSVFIEERFNEGFLHALKGGQLRESVHFRRSFRYGFRAGKLYLKEVRKTQGIAEFPIKSQFKIKVAA